MSTKTDLIEAHEAMAKLLDSKFSNVPEWKAFRAVDRALLGHHDNPTSAPARIGGFKILPLPRPGKIPSYMSLVDKALTETGEPTTTADLMEYIKRHRPLSGGDPVKAKIVVQSSLSKDKRFESVVWRDKRAWWYKGRALPK